MNKGCKVTVSFCKGNLTCISMHQQKLTKKFKMLNYSFVKKKKTKQNPTTWEIWRTVLTWQLHVVVINCMLNVPLMFTFITGNALVLVAILRTPSLGSVPSTIFVCSLAITNFLLLGLLSNLFPLPINFTIQLVSL